MITDQPALEGRPTEAVAVTGILEAAPTLPARAVPWLKTLSNDQFDAVWVALVTDLYERGSMRTVHVAEILTYVRARLRGSARGPAGKTMLSREERGRRIREGLAAAWRRRNAARPGNDQRG